MEVFQLIMMDLMLPFVVNGRSGKGLGSGVSAGENLKVQ